MAPICQGLTLVLLVYTVGALVTDLRALGTLQRIASVDALAIRSSALEQAGRERRPSTPR